MNRYVISDIHGCSLTFHELLSKIGFSKHDELILLGDYVNRGPRSKDVVDLILKLQSENYNITALQGNHEDMIFDSIELEDWTAGEEETLRSFEIQHLNKLNPKYIHFFKALKPYCVTRQFIFVHAGLNFNIKNPLDDTQSMRWIMNWYKDIDYKWLKDKIVVHGHHVVPRSTIQTLLDTHQDQQVINIDNGCYLNTNTQFGHLTCLNLDTMSLIFQKNIDSL